MGPCAHEERSARGTQKKDLEFFIHSPYARDAIEVQPCFGLLVPACQGQTNRQTLSSVRYDRRSTVLETRFGPDPQPSRRVTQHWLAGHSSDLSDSEYGSEPCSVFDWQSAPSATHIPFAHAFASVQLCLLPSPLPGQSSECSAWAAAPAVAVAATANNHPDQRLPDPPMTRAPARQPAQLPASIRPQTEHDAFNVPSYLTL